MPSAIIKTAQANSRSNPTVAPLPRNDKPTKTDIRALSNTDGISRAVNTLNADRIRLSPTSPATPPSVQSDKGAFGIDAYRDGGFEGPDDSMVQKYSVSDYESDEEAATIWLVGNDDNDIISAYGRFILQAVNESEAEKYQVVETFTDFYAFFYGKRPSIYRYAGILLDDPNFRWVNEFRFMYDNFFRGTAATELDATCRIQYSGRAVGGMVLGLSLNQQALDPKVVNFTIDVLVLDYTNDVFSADIAQLLVTKQNEVVALKAQIQRELASINKNIPTEQRLSAGQVFAGKKPASSAKKASASSISAGPVSLRIPTGGFIKGG